MALGETLLSAFLQVLFDRLAPRDLSFIPRPDLVHSDLEKWRRMLLKIDALLTDAEEKQLTDKLVKMWLDDLRDLAYDVEDVLDEFATEELERKLMADQRNIIADTGRALVFYTGIKFKMDDISSRLKQLWEEKDDLGLTKMAGGGTSSTVIPPRPSTTCIPTEPVVYGRDQDKVVLRDEPCSDANFGVLPIVGMANPAARWGP